MQAFNPNTWKAGGFEFLASLVYIVSSGQPGLPSEALSFKEKRRQLI